MAIIGAIIAIAGILMIYPGADLVRDATTGYLPVKTGTAPPYDCVYFRITWQYGEGRHEWFFYASDYVNLFVFDEEYYNDFSLGKTITVLDHLEHIKLGDSYVQGGPKGGPFFMAYENVGESDVEVSVHMSFIPTYSVFVFFGGVAVAIIGAIVVVVGLRLKPKVSPEEKKRPSEIADVTEKMEDVSRLRAMWKSGFILFFLFSGFCLSVHVNDLVFGEVPPGKMGDTVFAAIVHTGIMLFSYYSPRWVFKKSEELEKWVRKKGGQEPACS